MVVVWWLRDKDRRILYFIWQVSDPEQLALGSGFISYTQLAKLATIKVKMMVFARNLVAIFLWEFFSLALEII
jgi:hypothetical protein